MKKVRLLIGVVVLSILCSTGCNSSLQNDDMSEKYKIIESQKQNNSIRKEKLSKVENSHEDVVNDYELLTEVLDIEAKMTSILVNKIYDDDNKKKDKQELQEEAMEYKELYLDNITYIQISESTVKMLDSLEVLEDLEEVAIIQYNQICDFYDFGFEKADQWYDVYAEKEDEFSNKKDKLLSKYNKELEEI